MTQLRPLPRVCPVCEGTCAVRVVALLDFPTDARRMCPACFGVAGKPVQVKDLAWREDLPGDAA